VTNDYSNATLYAAFGQYASASPGTITGYYDDWIVRQYDSPEPSTGVGSEVTVFAADNPTIQPRTSLPFTSLSGFSETATKNGGEIKYQISNDSGTTWYWWDGSNWTTTTSGYTEANTASEINSHISSFPKGSFLFKAYLHSDGTQLVQLDSIDLTYAYSTGGGSGFLPLPNPPSPVSDVIATPGNGQVALSWTNPNGVSSKTLVYHKRGSGIPYLYRDYQSLIYNGTGFSYIDGNLTNDETYYYSIYTTDSYGQISSPVNVSATPRESVSSPQVSSGSSPPISRSTTISPATPPMVSQTSKISQGLEAIQAKIASLVSDVANLPRNPSASDLNLIQEKLLGIISELKSIQESQAPVSSASPFTTGLYYGLISDDVKKLQEVLKSDASVYPEGVVNGKFGPATLRAVKRFQIKYNITTENNPGYGYVGPKTRAKLNALSSQVTP